MTPNTIICGDALTELRKMPDECVQCVITSPPYFGLRDYGMPDQVGLEETPEAFTQKLVEIFREVRRVLKDDGTLWLNLGDSYAGSGRGRDADGTWNPGKGGSKQETNKGAITGRAVNAKSLSKNLIKKGAIGNAWVKPPKGLKQKDLIGIPWRVAFALQSDGWYLRQDIIWHKPNPMPESVTDRCTKAHEYIFLLTKTAKYYYDADAIKEPLASSSILRLSQDIENQQGSFRVPGKTNGAMKSVRGRGSIRPHGVVRNRALAYDSKENAMRGMPEATVAKESEIEEPTPFRNKRSVWTVTTKPFKGAHFATFPTELIEPMILAGCPENGLVLDPFMGAGTTGLVAKKLGRHYLGIELNPEYVAMAAKRIGNVPQSLFMPEPAKV